MTDAFWTARWDQGQQLYKCAWCDNMLKCMTSKSAANPNRNFVSCNKDYGGCGLFCFLDKVPDEKFNPNKKKAAVKRGREGGQSITGPATAPPMDNQLQIASLATEVADLRAELKALHERVTMLEEN